MTRETFTESFRLDYLNGHDVVSITYPLGRPEKGFEQALKIARARMGYPTYNILVAITRMTNGHKREDSK